MSHTASPCKDGFAHLMDRCPSRPHSLHFVLEALACDRLNIGRERRSPAKVIRFWTMRPIWSPRAPLMAAVSVDSLEARAPRAFCSLSNQPTSCVEPMHQPSPTTSCLLNILRGELDAFALQMLRGSPSSDIYEKIAQAVCAEVDPHRRLNQALTPRAQASPQKCPLKDMLRACRTWVRARLAEHGAEEENAQAPGQALAHAGKAVLLQHAHHDGARADARKHGTPLGHLPILRLASTMLRSLMFQICRTGSCRYGVKA